MPILNLDVCESRPHDDLAHLSQRDHRKVMTRRCNERLYLERERVPVSSEPVAHKQQAARTQDPERLFEQVLLVAYVDYRVLAEDHVDRPVRQRQPTRLDESIRDASVKLEPPRALSRAVDQSRLDVDSRDRAGTVLLNEDDVDSASAAPDVQHIASLDVAPAEDPGDLGHASGRQKPLTPDHLEAPCGAFGIPRILDIVDLIHARLPLPSGAIMDER
jgi:hypothetical protein